MCADMCVYCITVSSQQYTVTPIMHQCSGLSVPREWSELIFVLLCGQKVRGMLVCSSVLFSGSFQLFPMGMLSKVGGGVEISQ